MAKIWGITGGRRGNDVLVDGIAQALIRDMGGEYRLMHAGLSAPWKWLAPYRLAERGVAHDEQITPHIKSDDWPDMVIASGRQAAPHARFIKRASGGRVYSVFLQNPMINPKHFDFVWAPEHDQLRGPNVISTLLSPHAMTRDGLKTAGAAMKARLLPDNMSGKAVAVLIGGPNKVYPFTPDEMTRLAHGLASIAAQGHYLMITLSRRSPESYADSLRAALPDGSYFLWDNVGDNPYPAMLGLAEQIIVTGDSVNMVGEACLPGVPVQVFTLRGGSAKFDRFRAELSAADMTRPFSNTLESWSMQAHNPTDEIALAIKNAYAAHKNI